MNLSQILHKSDNKEELLLQLSFEHDKRNFFEFGIALFRLSIPHHPTILDEFNQLLWKFMSIAFLNLQTINDFNFNKSQIEWQKRRIICSISSPWYFLGTVFSLFRFENYISWLRRNYIQMISSSYMYK